MNEFRPHVDVASQTVAPPRRPQRRWLAAGVGALVLGGWLLFSSGDPDESRESAPPAATRGAAVPAAATRSPVTDLPRAEPYAPDPAGRAVLDALTLAPAAARSGGTGYVVTKADAELLAHTPLREGDVLLELDGQKLDPARLERLGEELGDYDDVWVSFERDGKKLETLLELRRR